LALVADPAIVLVLLLSRDAADPATQAILPAARRPLGEDTVVLVQQSETLPSDDEALALARQVHARSAVRLAWEDAAHSRMRLRVFLVDGGRRYDYELAFDPHDQPAERGRAIGLAMTPVLTRALAATPPLDAPAAGATPAATPLADSAAVAPASIAPAASTAAPASLGPVSRESPLPPSAMHAGSWLALDVASSASVGLGGNALGIGPTVGLRALVLGPVALHAVGVARFGAVDAASASAATLGLGGGAAARLLRVGEGARALDLGARLDVLAMQHALTQDEGGAVGGGSTVRRARWLTAVDVVAEAAWPLARHLDLAVGAGAEIAMGPTAVTVGGRPVDHIPVGRAIAELGVRVPF
jgi:hypothetical protein